MLDTEKQMPKRYVLALAAVLLAFAIVLTVPVFAKENVKTQSLYGVSVDSVLVKQGYGLYVDGTLIAVCESVEAAEAALDKVALSLAEAYGAPDGTHTLYNDIQVSEGEYSKSLFADASGVCYLLGCRENGLVFEVYNALGTLTDISLNVSTLATLKTQEVVDAPYKEIGTDLLKEGESLTVKEGVDGISLNEYSVTYVNGVQKNEVLLESTVISEAVEGELWYGTESGATLMSADEKLMMPCGGYVTSWYGGRTLWGEYDFHDGIDFAGSGASYGDPIYAAADGIVSFAAFNGGFGNKIVIDHSKEISTLYAHCSKIVVSEGQAVVKGQLIGYIGATGRVTGPHLHLEVLVNGYRANPKSYLDWSGYQGAAALN